jgi:mono/diheme cytochrome c family protein
MARFLPLLLACLFVFSGAHAEDLNATWKSEVFPLFENHCYDCHGDGLKKGELALDDFESIADMQADRERWKRIRSHIDQRLMPPIDEEQPTADARAKMVRWIDAAVFPVNPDKPDPGRVTLRRLNRVEYENTLQDLLGVRLNIQDLLPPDDSGYGFDNIGDVLTLSPVHLERFLTTARIALNEALTLTGPPDKPRPPKTKSHQLIYGERRSGESDDAWATRVFTSFAKKAFRRPLENGEAERYLHFIRLARQENQSIEHGIRHGLEAMLVSPSFLFREEPQPEPDNPGRIHLVNEHVLASRLSYFLWSTMPDSELTRLADENQLRANLTRQIDRMLDSPRSNEFITHFIGQWLQLRDLPSATPSNKVFRNFARGLQGDMARETTLLVTHMLRENRPVTDFINADYTFLNERLATHYGITGVTGNEFQRVSLAGHPRRGILGHGSFLLVTSHPLRTSPVLRGKFVLENLLDMAPPPPPPNVPQLTPPSQHGDALSLREQMEKHRDDPACASCHALMDPIGFGLQNFDADGSWRTTENGKPIDVSGELFDGITFQGPDELRALLLKHHQNDFIRSMASKMLTYALGRGTDWYDKPALDGIVNGTITSNLGTRNLIHAVIRSVPFQYRRGDE